MENDEIVICYKSICLRKSDVECFEDNNRLNDMAIAFYYEVLSEREEYKRLMENVVLVDPASASLIFYDYEIEDLIDMFKPLRFEEKELIFFPINDNTDKYSYAAGNHWALLVYQKSDETFYYFDSICSFINNTKILASKFLAMKANNTYDSNKEKIPKIVNLISSKLQFNSYDCGIFIIAFTEVILKFMSRNKIHSQNFLLNSEEFKDYLKFSDINQKKIKLFRKEILKHIETLKIK